MGLVQTPYPSGTQTTSGKIEGMNICIYTGNQQNDTIAYVPLDPVAGYIYIAELIQELLNFLTKIFPVFPGNPRFW